MIICNKCGASLQDDATFCSVCGNHIDYDLEDTGILNENASFEFESDETTVLEYGDNKVNNNQQQFYNQNNSSGNFYGGESAPSAYPDNSNRYAQNNNQNGNNYGNPPVSDNTYDTPVYNNQPSQPNQTQYNQQDMNYSGNNVNGKMTYLDFFNSYASKKTKNLTTALGIICIVTCALSLVFVMIGKSIALMDFVFYLVFAILTFKLKRWYIALPVCIYGGLFTIIGLILSASPTGIVAFVISILATIQLKKLEGAYNNYSSTNQLPNGEI